MFQKALIALNLKEPVSRIAGALSTLSSFGTREVLLLHAVGGGRKQVAERKLRQLARDLENGTVEYGEIELSVHTRSGSPANTIDRFAREMEVNLLCIPWKRKSWIQRSLVGSTTKDVIRLTDHPVFVYKGSERNERSALEILYATALQERDDTILPYLSYEGLQAARLVLLHVGERAPDPKAEERRRQKVSLGLKRLSQEVEAEEREIEVRNETGKPKRLIPRTGRREGVDLIVLGKSEGSTILSGVLGSTAEEVAYSSKPSVLIIGKRVNQ